MMKYSYGWVDPRGIYGTTKMSYRKTPPKIRVNGSNDWYAVNIEGIKGEFHICQGFVSHCKSPRQEIDEFGEGHDGYFHFHEGGYPESLRRAALYLRKRYYGQKAD